MEKVTLEKLRYGLDKRFSSLLVLDEFDWRQSVLDKAYYELTMRFHAFGEEFPPIVRSHSYPADWWQMFKKRFFPRWAVAKCPIRYKRVDLIVTPHVVYDNIPRPSLPPDAYPCYLYTDIEVTE